MSLIEEIYAAVLPEMKANDIEDTVENRIIFLTGLRNSWLEENDDWGTTKGFYLMSLTNEIVRLKITKRFPKL